MKELAPRITEMEWITLCRNECRNSCTAAMNWKALKVPENGKWLHGLHI